MFGNNVLGIIFAYAHEERVRDLTELRVMASVPFGGRYRLVDFTLSNMVNSGLNKVGIITEDNYQSLMDHLGSGKAWDLSRKREGLYLLPPDSASFVDLCVGAPRRTRQARCLTARYGQTTLSNHRGERSGVLLIQEATKKRYQEAGPGDTVDLGYAGSATRAGRVGQRFAHDAASVQGVVERGGRIRRLTSRECLRLQGFEDSQIDKILAITSDAQAYKQAGNSVTVTVIEAIGRRIRAVDEALRKEAVA